MLRVGASAGGHQHSVHPSQRHLLAFTVLGYHSEVAVGVLLHLLGAEGGVHVDALPPVLCLYMLPAFHVEACTPVMGQGWGQHRGFDGDSFGVRRRFDWTQLRIR